MHNFNDQPLNDQLVATLEIFRNHTETTIIARYSSSPIRSPCAKRGLQVDLGPRRDSSVKERQNGKISQENLQVLVDAGDSIGLWLRSIAE